jgi:hypothetical protein
MNDEDIVYSPASITNPGVVHTDQECPRLQRANQVLEHPADAYPENVETCEWCAGDEDIIADDGPSGPWQDLQAMDPDDLVTDGGDEIAPECVDEHGSPQYMTDGGESLDGELTKDDFKQLLAHQRFRSAVVKIRSIGIYLVALSLGIFTAVYARRLFDIAPVTLTSIATGIGLFGMAFSFLGPRWLRSRAGGVADGE